MSAIGFGDELVREYLVFRGFLSALKAFESEIKSDKDRGFRPDRIVEYLRGCIVNLDLSGLRDAWAHLDQRFFSRLEHSFLSTAKKLETALLRMYLITCISSGRQDKLLDFFESSANDLQGQSEWKDWFALPFIKNADEHPNFTVYFTRQWQDTMLLSLHNFISVVFQSAAMPTLLSYEDELIKLQQLTEENEILRKKLVAAGISFEMDIPKVSRDIESQEMGFQSELMDDFYVIAQELPPDIPGRSIKSIIKNIGGGGLPTSPILNRRLAESRRQEEDCDKTGKVKPRSPSVPPRPSNIRSSSVYEHTQSKKQLIETNRSISVEDRHLMQEKQSRITPRVADASPSPPPQTLPTVPDQKSGFIILSREKYAEHNSKITHCKFNSSGTVVASSDMDGVIKIWNATPSLLTLSTVMSKTSVLSLEWGCKREQLLLYGGTSGIVRLYDTKERKVVKEIYAGNSGSQNKVLCICCNPMGTSFVSSTDFGDDSHLSLWDMKTLLLQSNLPLVSKPSCVYCCSFNHNGQLLLVGSSDGLSSILDLRTSENIASWHSHPGGVISTQFSMDETSCYTMGKDGKFLSWSINKTGHQISEFNIHSDAAGVTSDNQSINSFGKKFTFNNEDDHVLTCGPLGGIIYKISDYGAESVLDIGGHNQPVNTVDWSTAMECSTCLCGTIDGKIIVSTLLNQ